MGYPRDRFRFGFVLALGDDVYVLAQCQSKSNLAGIGSGYRVTLFFLVLVFLLAFLEICRLLPIVDLSGIRGKTRSVGSLSDTLVSTRSIDIIVIVCLHGRSAALVRPNLSCSF